MTTSEYICSKYGKNVKRNKSTSGYQCVDAAKDFCVDGPIDIYSSHPELKKSWAWGNAIDWFNKPNAVSKEVFQFIKHTSKTAICEGDLVVFKTSQSYGHIAVAIGISSADKVLTLDQNYGSKNNPLQVVCHNRDTIVGILRKKVK